MMWFFKSFRIIFLLLIIDLITKYLFFDMELIQNIFHATFNTWISFGIGIPQSAIQIITSLFLICIIYLLHIKKIHPVIAILIIAGGLGNLLDRIFLWWVRDFIRLGFGPVFNVADIYINLAVVYYILFEIRNKE
jgi:signal peptidase II